jgi:acetylornithine deacetylase/succinyl-diaminopimelate desuccinylase-like protein
MEYTQIDQYLETHLDESIEELRQYIRQPSISAQSMGMEECAEIVRTMLVKRGFLTQVFPTSGAPIVCAERKGSGDKSLLIYNHYDVQPPDPLDLWETPPFEPVLKDGKLFGRGSSDDKGQLVYRLFALDALLSTMDNLPCTIKFLIEGEEESSSESLPPFVRDHKEVLNSDACIWEYGVVDEQDRPLVSLGYRGIQYVELSVETANQDTHSGLGGTIFPNAAWRLIWALNSLKGQDENVRIAGFYNKVKPVPYRTRALLEALPDPAPGYLEQYGVKGFLRGRKGGADLRLAEAHEPSCTICGLTSGYQGPGSKTILPARASAKVDFRLVPDQDPLEIMELLRAHLDINGFEDIQIQDLGYQNPAVTNPDDPFVQLVVKTAAEVFGEPMKILPSSGGSSPTSIVREHLDIPIVGIGAGYPGAQMHAPNENLRVDLYLKAAKHFARIIMGLADLNTHS